MPCAKRPAVFRYDSLHPIHKILENETALTAKICYEIHPLDEENRKHEIEVNLTVRVQLRILLRTHFDDGTKFEVTKLSYTVNEEEQMISFFWFTIVDIEIIKSASFNKTRFQL